MSTKQIVIFTFMIIFLAVMLFGLGSWFHYATELEIAARCHDVIAIQLIDPRERELPDVGILTLRDPERGQWVTVDTSQESVRTRFRQRAAAFDAGLDGRLRRAGADVIRLQTGASYVGPLLAFFRRRERRHHR